MQRERSLHVRLRVQSTVKYVAQEPSTRIYMYPAGYILIYNYYKPLNAERQTQRVSSAAVGTGRVQTETAQHGGRGGAELRWALSYMRRLLSAFFLIWPFSYLHFLMSEGGSEVSC